MNLLDLPTEIVAGITDYAGSLACTMMYMTCTDLKKHVRGKIANKCNLHVMAAATGRVKLFQWISSVVPEHLLMKTAVINTAAKNKRLEFLQWACSVGYAIHDNVCTQAAFNNDYRMLKWYLAKVINCIPKGAITAALFNNNFQLVKWLVQKGSRWCLSWVARYGRLNVLKWLNNRNDFAVRDKFGIIIDSALNHKQFHILEWCLSIGYKMSAFDTYSLNCAILAGNIRAVKAICDNVVQNSVHFSPHFFPHTIFKLEMCECAARHGQLRILQYMYDFGFIWDTATIRQVANKHVHVIEWLDTLVI